MSRSSSSSTENSAETNWTASRSRDDSSVRRRIASLRYTRVRCCSTVLTVMKSFRAIWSFVDPLAASSATRNSALLR